jgi:hypothetical protein
MSAWRRQAMKALPERAHSIEHARSIYDLWFELLSDLQAAYRVPQPPSDFINRVWAFAAWCFEPQQNPELRNAVAVSFYEHLAHLGPARRELASRLTREQFEELLPAFKTVLTAEEYAVFVPEMLLGYGVSSS